ARSTISSSISCRVGRTWTTLVQNGPTWSTVQQLTRRGRAFQAYRGLEVRLGRRCRGRPQSGPRQQRIAQEDRDMRNIKTLVVTAGAALVLGGIGVGVAQAASPGAAPATVTTSTSSTHHSHESEARGRVAEGETHARHTGTDDSPAARTDQGAHLPGALVACSGPADPAPAPHRL